MVISKNKVFIPLNACPGVEITLDDIVKERYFITKEGEVFDRFLEKYLPTHINTGYNRVTFRMQSGKQKSYYVHVLVACMYLGDFRETKTVNHENGNKQINSLYNLKWMTHHENITHAISNNLIKNRKSLTEDMVIDMCERLEKGESILEISEAIGVKKKTVEGVKHGYNWKHISSRYNIKSERPNKYLKEDIVRLVCSEIEKGLTNEFISNKHNISINNVRSVRTGNFWKHIRDQYNIPKVIYEKRSKDLNNIIIDELREPNPQFKQISLKYNVHINTLMSMYKRHIMKPIYDEINK